MIRIGWKTKCCDCEAVDAALRDVLAAAPDYIISFDRDRRITFINRLMPGFTLEQVIGTPIIDFLMPEAREASREAIDRIFETGVGEIASTQVVTPAGATRWFETRVGPILHDGIVTGGTMCSTDITERMQLEEQFRQAHKMEAFGQLAGGVAHDFNNLLTVILGGTDLLVSALGPDHEALPSLTEIYDAGQRAATLTRQLLAFSRKTVLAPQVIDLNGTVREAETMLARLIGEDVAFKTTLSPNLAQVHVDPGQLLQVIMNLSVNARDAMPKGGQLVIATKNVHRTVDGITRDWVHLSVADSGEGMTDEVRNQIFQPFFTTKEVGKGTGLGLAVVHGIVLQSGGRIEVETAEGKGTRFDIFLPAVAEAEAAPSKRPQKAESTSAGTETVLLVEDEGAVRRFAGRALQKKGYQVVGAANAAEALKILEEGPPIDVVITDVVMPGMDGGNLGEIIGAKFPMTSVIYTSGYTDDILLRWGIQTDAVAFLAKPYSPAALLTAVRTALDG